MLVALIMVPPLYFLPSGNLMKDFMFVALVVIAPFLVREMSQLYDGSTDK